MRSLMFSLIWLCIGITYVQADTDIKQQKADFFNDAPASIHDMWPFKVFNNTWVTTPEVRTYFNQQKKILKYLSKQQENSTSDGVSFAALGDMLRIADQQEYLSPALKSYLAQTDIVTGNLETLISSNSPYEVFNFFIVNSHPAIVSTTQLQPNEENDFKKNIYTILSTSNNHSFDYPDPAQQDTLNALKKHGVQQNGLRLKNDKEYTVFEKKGIKFAFYAATTFVNKVDIQDNASVQTNMIYPGMTAIPWKEKEVEKLEHTKAIITAMRKEADVVLLSLHWGFEHESYPRPEQVELAHKLIGFGVDIIIGNHSHAIQPSEVCFVNGYENNLPSELAQAQKLSGCTLQTEDKQQRKALIHYSLGNFIGFTPMFWQQLGLIASLNFKKDEQKVDWHSPKQRISYDYVDVAPYGKHTISFLDDYLIQNCFSNSCPIGTRYMAAHAQEHIFSPSISKTEELKLVLISFANSFPQFMKNAYRYVFHSDK